MSARIAPVNGAMSNPWVPLESLPSRLQPLGEFPALDVADARRDVRGCEIRSEEGEVLGLVSISSPIPIDSWPSFWSCRS